ncbi:MAG: DUF6242 domain-containing protein [Bacteroidales bacterium]
MKIRKIYFLAISALVLAVSACKDDKQEIDYSGYTDALVKSFKLADNSKVAPNLSSVYFTINQYGKKLPDNKLTGDSLVGEIFNADSLPVGTNTSKLIAEIGFSDPKKVMLYTASDTTEYVSTDSIDFSKPVIIEVLAGNGVNKKFYEVKVNVHHQVPDSIHWEEFIDSPLADAGKIMSQKAVNLGAQMYWLIRNASGVVLYTAPVSNLKSWTKHTTSGVQSADLTTLSVFGNDLYVVDSNGSLLKSADGENWGVVAEGSETLRFTNLIGEFNQLNATAQLIALTQNKGDYYFAYSTDGISWKQEGVVPARFPLVGYSNPVQYAGGTTQRIVIVGGKMASGQLTSSSWNYDGINVWQEFRQPSLPQMEGLSLVSYETDPRVKDTFWMLLNGETASGKFSKEVYVSPNKGISWTKADTLYTMPANYDARAFSSVYVDSDYFINLLGGENNQGELNQLWRGRLNKLAFKPVE